jgi:hypothetical protein
VVFADGEFCRTVQCPLKVFGVLDLFHVAHAQAWIDITIGGYPPKIDFAHGWNPG